MSDELLPKTKRTNFFFLAFGIILLSVPIYFRIREFGKLYVSPDREAMKQTEVITYDPYIIEIERIGLKIEVVESGIVDGVWEVSDKAANHLDISADPGGGGNILLYAHNRDNLFGPIKFLKRDDLIKIIDGSGNVHKYRVESAFETDPSDVKIASNTESEVLTIYTCSGLFDRKRFVIRAVPESM